MPSHPSRRRRRRLARAGLAGPARLAGSAWWVAILALLIVAVVVAPIAKDAALVEDAAFCSERGNAPAFPGLLRLVTPSSHCARRREQRAYQNVSCRGGGVSVRLPNATRHGGGRGDLGAAQDAPGVRCHTCVYGMDAEQGPPTCTCRHPGPNPLLDFILPECSLISSVSCVQLTSCTQQVSHAKRRHQPPSPFGVKQADG